MPQQQSNGWGGSRPGAGRKPKLQVVPGSSSSSSSGPTLGQALESLRQAAPPSAVHSAVGNPVPKDAPGAAPPAEVTRPENESFAKLVGYVGTNVGVLVISDSIKKSGLEPQEPDPEDIERTSDATSKAIQMALGDAAIPWWGTLVAAWGSLYLSMRIGARPIKSAANDNAVTNDNAAASSSPAPAAAASVLGQGVAQPKRASAYQPLPEVGQAK